MPIEIQGWTVNDTNAREICAAIAEVEGVAPTTVTAAYVRNWMGGHVKQLVFDKRKRDAVTALRANTSDPLS
tara:strand:+ start:532 stop:747 length:216 start_codon:yes stop_codon:yes gene_type:complete